MQLVRANLERIFAWSAAVLIIGYFISQLAFLPHEINPDEGINLIKGTLLADGFKFLSEIWSDQPPFLSWVYSLYLSLFPKTILYARYLMVFFASLMSLGFFGLLYKKTSVYTAILALTFLLFFNPIYSYYFNAMMIGMPAIALLILSMYLVYEKEEISKWAAMLSGALAAFSMQTKFFTLLGIVWILFYLIANKRSSTLKNFLAAFVSINVFMIFKFNLHKFEILIAPHLKLSLEQKFEFSQRLGFINQEVGTYFLLFYFLACGILILKKKSWSELILPLGWSLSACLMIFLHSPLWQHLLLIFLVPAVWCMALGAHQLVLTIPKLNPKFLLPLFVVTMALSLFLAKPRTHAKNGQMLQSYNEISHLIKLHESGAERPTVFSDRPIYAFLNNGIYPPELACISEKRIRTQFLTEAWMLELLTSRPPQFIIISRFYDFFQRSSLQNFLGQHYHRLPHHIPHSKDQPLTIYVRK